MADNRPRKGDRAGNRRQGPRTSGPSRAGKGKAGKGKTGGGRRTPPPKAGGSRRRSADQRSHGSTRRRPPTDEQAAERKRRVYTAGGGPSNIPRWLRDEIVRVTPKDRREGVLVLFSEAAADFADEKFGKAHPKLLQAKRMASRAPAIRELLGLTAYRLHRWDEALRELRAFRRMAGDTTHMPVEMDVLRALDRPADVHKTWELFQELGGRPFTDAEARVVYGSFLLDQGDPRVAWEVTKPRRVTKEAPLGELRRWYVAARAAATLGDTATARQLARAIEEADEDGRLEGLDLLDAEISRAEAAGG